MGAVNLNHGTARDADAGKQNDEQGSRGANSGSDKEIDERLIKAHGEQYGANGPSKRGY